MQRSLCWLTSWHGDNKHTRPNLLSACCFHYTSSCLDACTVTHTHTGFRGGLAVLQSPAQNVVCGRRVVKRGRCSLRFTRCGNGNLILLFCEQIINQHTSPPHHSHHIVNTHHRHISHHHRLSVAAAGTLRTSCQQWPVNGKYLTEHCVHRQVLAILLASGRMILLAY